MNIAIIIPTYNEAGNIKSLVEEIIELGLKETAIIVVDDNSPDDTGRIVDRLAQKHSGKIEVIHRPRKLGLGSAYKDGFRKAMKDGAKIFVTMDADLSHNPKGIPEMLQKLKRNDVVVGSRHIKGGKIVGFSVFRHTLSYGAQWLSMNIAGITVHDSTSSFRAYKREVIVKVNPQTIKSEGYSFLIELIYRGQKKGYKITEIPITYVNRTRGKSKISQTEILKALATIFRLKFRS